MAQALTYMWYLQTKLQTMRFPKQEVLSQLGMMLFNVFFSYQGCLINNGAHKPLQHEMEEELLLRLQH